MHDNICTGCLLLYLADRLQTCLNILLLINDFVMLGPPGPLGLHGLDGLKGVKGDIGTRGMSLSSCDD